MDAPLVMVAVALAASPLGLLWEGLHRKADERRRKQAACIHDWDRAPVINVFKDAPTSPRAYFVQHCPKCHLQRACDRVGRPRE